MEVYRGLEEVRPDPRAAHLALGTFDGVHRGHQEVLGRARLGAAEEGGRAIGLTFDPHPLRVVAPPPEAILLTTIEERLDLFADLGLEAAVVVRFDAATREIPAPRWMDLLAEALAPAAVYASADHAFGRDRAGSVDTLRAAGSRWDFRVIVVPPVHVDGVLVSSTLIRRLLRAGSVEQAAVFLGRWYALRGRVVEGARRGRMLGFPTANLAVDPDKVLPARGIYAAWGIVESEALPTAVSVGTRPTFGPGEMLVEAHLLDVDLDLYGRSLEVRFVRRLRDEVAFRTVPELIRQMEEDVRAARDVLGVHSPSGPPADAAEAR